MPVRRILALAPLLVLGIALTPRPAEGQLKKLRVRETRISRLPKGAEFRTERHLPVRDFSRDFSRAAYVYGNRAGKEFLATDAGKSALYDLIRFPHFTADGRRVLAEAINEGRRGKRRYTMLVDLKETGFYDRSPSRPALSKSGRYAYFVERSSRVLRAAGLRWQSTEKALVVDGQMGPWSTGYRGDLAFNPVTDKLSYLASKRARRGKADTWFVVTDGNRRRVRCQKHERKTPDLHFDSAGRRYVFAHRADGRSCIEIDGVTSTVYDEVTRIIDEPVSGRLLYAAKRGGKRYVVSERGEHGPYDRINYLHSETHPPHWVVSRAGKRLLVTDAQEFQYPRNLERCDPSGDGAHLACLTRIAGEIIVTLDGKEVMRYKERKDAVNFGYLRVDAAGRRIAFQIVDGDETFVAYHDAATGKSYRSKAYGSFSRLDFTPDGSGLRFIAGDGRESFKATMALP